MLNIWSPVQISELIGEVGGGGLNYEGLDLIHGWNYN